MFGKKTPTSLPPVQARYGEPYRNADGTLYYTQGDGAYTCPKGHVNNTLVCLRCQRIAR